MSRATSFSLLILPSRRPNPQTNFTLPKKLLAKDKSLPRVKQIYLLSIILSVTDCKKKKKKNFKKLLEWPSFQNHKCFLKFPSPCFFFLHLLCYSNLPAMFSVLIFSGALSRAKRSTMSKKIWFRSTHPRNVGSHVTVRPRARPRVRQHHRHTNVR